MRWIVAILACAGCVRFDADPGSTGGGGDPNAGGDGSPDASVPDATTSAARAAYERDVYPIHVESCGGCHAVLEDPTFVDLLDAGDSYSDTKSFPGILGAFNAAAPIAAHHGLTYYTLDERQK